MPKAIGLRSLKPVSILFEGDFYILARFMLKTYDALHAGTDTKARPTVHGVASAYERLNFDVPVEFVKDRVTKCGIDLGATVEFDKNLS